MGSPFKMFSFNAVGLFLFALFVCLVAGLTTESLAASGRCQREAIEGYGRDDSKLGALGLAKLSWSEAAKKRFGSSYGKLKDAKVDTSAPHCIDTTKHVYGIMQRTPTYGDVKGNPNKRWLCSFTAFPCASIIRRTFQRPQWKDTKMRIDWCYYFGRDCGKIAADGFCKSKKYHSANGYRKDEAIGGRSPTITLGDERVCSNARCDGFKYIKCEWVPRR